MSQRLRELQGYCEEVMRLVDVESLVDEGEGPAITVMKDHGGPPGAVIVQARHKDGRLEDWKQGGAGWYVSKTEWFQ